VSIVDTRGNVIVDSYVQPLHPVSSYRTQYSGIREVDLIPRPDHPVLTFKEAQTAVKRAIGGHVVVGHSLHTDFAVLKMRHPPALVRDTADYGPLQISGARAKLRTLAAHFLGRTIQESSHCSVQDANAAMDLYLMFRDQWEQSRIFKQPDSCPASS